jgi:hypothetical protein
VLKPWTQRLSLSWRPELRFYEQRIAILKKLEEQGYLRAFRVEESFVDAQLFETRDRLTVRQDGADILLLSPEAEPARALEALCLALAEVRPTTPRTISGSFQYIAPIALDFLDAVARGYGRVLGNPLGDLSHGDWAVLTDIILESPPASGIVEFGIIKAEEAPDRLARRAGRTGRAPQPQRWDPDQFPDVAVFCDGTLSGALGDDSEKIPEVAAKFWSAARDAHGSLVEGLRTMLMSDDDLRKVEAK